MGSSSRGWRFARWSVKCAAQLCVVAAARGDILAVTLSDEQLAEKYADYVVDLVEGPTLFGEAQVDLQERVAGNLVEWPAEERFELILLDPADPQSVPYKWRDGERSRVKKQRVCAFAGRQTSRIAVHLSGETIESLKREYLRRSGRLEPLQKAWRSRRRESPADLTTLARLSLETWRLEDWMRRSGYHDAAARLAPAMEELAVAERQLGVAQRLESSLASVRTDETPEKLRECAANVSKGTDDFAVQSSLHVRIVYVSEVHDERVRDGLCFAERLIEGFRREHIDSHPELAGRDLIPERTFCEFWFGPNEDDRHERYLEEYYGLAWMEGEARTRQLAFAGSHRWLPRSQVYLDYCRRSLADALFDYLAHRIGDHLADVQYGAELLDGGKHVRTTPPWLSEAVGYHLSIEHLGRNGSSCTSIPRKGKSTSTPGDWRSAWELSSRGRYLELAQAAAARLDTLLSQSLHDLDDADVAKGWSLYEYLTREHGGAGESYLQAMCELARDPNRFLPMLRDETVALLDGSSPADAFVDLDERWRLWLGE